MDWKSIEDVKQFTSKYGDVVDELTSVLQKHKVPYADGENMMLMLAGLSAGLRQAPITGDFIVPVASGWVLAAKFGDHV